MRKKNRSRTPLSLIRVLLFFSHHPHIVIFEHVNTVDDTHSPPILDISVRDECRYYLDNHSSRIFPPSYRWGFDEDHSHTHCFVVGAPDEGGGPDEDHSHTHRRCVGAPDEGGGPDEVHNRTRTHHHTFRSYNHHAMGCYPGPEVVSVYNPGPRPHTRHEPSYEHAPTLAVGSSFPWAYHLTFSGYSEYLSHSSSLPWSCLIALNSFGTKTVKNCAYDVECHSFPFALHHFPVLTYRCELCTLPGEPPARAESSLGNIVVAVDFRGFFGSG